MVLSYKSPKDLLFALLILLILVLGYCAANDSILEDANALAAAKLPIAIIAFQWLSYWWSITELVPTTETYRRDQETIRLEYWEQYKNLQ